MQEIVLCPTCKTEYEHMPSEDCPNCGFPFHGTEKEKSRFIGQQVLKKGRFSETRDHIRNARIILIIIGILNFLSILRYFNDPNFKTYIIGGLILGSVFIGFAFLTYRKPFISILIPFILLICIYAFQAIVNPGSLIHGLIGKVVYIGALMYALISIAYSEYTKMESDFLKNKSYK